MFVCMCVYVWTMWCRLPLASTICTSTLGAQRGSLSSSSHCTSFPPSICHCRISEQAVRGRPMVQSVSRRPYTGENWFPSQASTYGHCGRQSVGGTVTFPSFFICSASISNQCPVCVL
jgi:hypothetical protein